jgi:hypothetical protein
MLNYVQGYYTPGPGYRSTANTEQALQLQRERTVEAIVNALENYTGFQFGTDSEKWMAYLGATGL